MQLVVETDSEDVESQRAAIDVLTLWLRGHPPKSENLLKWAVNEVVSFNRETIRYYRVAKPPD